MATQTIRVCTPLAAGTYTANVQEDGSNTNAFTGLSLTVEANASFWTFAVTAATAGLYAFQILSGSTVVAYGWFFSDTDSGVTIQDSSSRDEALVRKDTSQISTLATPASILNTALTEAYAADGAAPTLTQLLFLVQQHLSDVSISGTTKTVKKIDGTTTAATFTLDSATTPTSITRAT